MSNIRQFVGGPTRTVSLTSGSSISAPNWAVGVLISGCGAGGGGGGVSAAINRDSGGGGSAMEVHDLFLPVAGGSSIAYAIGAAGAAGSSAGGSGGAGGSTTFTIGGVLYTLFGGRGGLGATTTTDQPGGAGGDWTGGFPTVGFKAGVGANPTGPIVATLGTSQGPWVAGSGGGAVAMPAAIQYTSAGPGAGCGSSFGRGGLNGQDAVGVAGKGYGAGGSGCSNVASATGKAGGAGAPGLLRMTFVG